MISLLDVKNYSQKRSIVFVSEKDAHSALTMKSSTGKVILDTDEESLADFIGGLSGSSSSRTSHENSPRAPSTPRVSSKHALL
jgi:hypothetical protein